MKIAILSSRGSSVIHAIFFLQVNDIRVDEVIIAGDPSEYTLLSEYSVKNGFGLQFVDKINCVESLEYLKRIQPEILIIMCTSVVSTDVIASSKYVLNIHAGVLPEYRGLDVRRWAILQAGEIGVTAHLVDEGVDTGDIIVSKKVDLQQGDTIDTIMWKLYYKCRFQAMVEAVRRIESGENNFLKQSPQDGKRYFKMHDKLRALVDRKLDKYSAT